MEENKNWKPDKLTVKVIYKDFSRDVIKDVFDIFSYDGELNLCDANEITVYTIRLDEIISLIVEKGE